VLDVWTPGFLARGILRRPSRPLLEDWPGINLGVTPDNWDKEVVAAQHLDSANSLPSVPWIDQAAPWRGPLVDSMTTWAVPMDYMIKVQKEEF